jgi:hypothetical protein
MALLASKCMLLKYKAGHKFDDPKIYIVKAGVVVISKKLEG